MLQVVYVSTAKQGAGEQLGQILKVSQANNGRDGITGLLHYDGVRFLQALEGPTHLVQQAMARIKTDERHRAIVTLSSRTVDAREFGDWAMAHRRTHEDAGSFVDRVAALVANAAPSVRATFESFAALRRAA